MLSELNLEVQQKTDRLAEVELRLKDCLAEKAQEEERLSRRLRDSHETIASLRAQSPPVKVSHGLAAWCRARASLDWPQRPASGPRGQLARGSGCEWWKAAPQLCTQSVSGPSRLTARGQAGTW